MSHENFIHTLTKMNKILMREFHLTIEKQIIQMKTTDQVKQAVEAFVRAGDTNDTALLEMTLHPDFQNVQSGFFEKPGIFVFTKSDYKDLVASKRFGGSPRTIDFLTIEEAEGIAQVKVRLESEFLIFTSLLVLVCENDCWKVIHNIPQIVIKHK